jgi:hypothetical protein
MGETRRGEARRGAQTTRGRRRDGDGAGNIFTFLAPYLLSSPSSSVSVSAFASISASVSAASPSAFAWKKGRAKLLLNLLITTYRLTPAFIANRLIPNRFPLIDSFLIASCLSIPSPSLTDRFHRSLLMFTDSSSSYCYLLVACCLLSCC